ncbi:Uncharacterized protein FWK35_00011258 [Aphis craccivora]|uniref:NADH dehydrogenase [ubiquinone] 1 alpha subcomplex assembly factor 2 n=1 Tax=Aphis craccivora TaxID=307492 RepID=A0A6G0YTZ6_APHCR|nr:Uncharacterized protein FWK35_00011258 [Aphis craccivora]
MPSERRLWKIVFENFLKSLQPKLKEKPVGSDAQGNKYFELQADPQGGRRLPRRWFVPVNEETGVPTPEWSQWLRGRRDEPPTPEEIAHNEAISNMKKINAENIAEKFRITDSKDNETKYQQNSKGFPDMSEEFERQPGNLKSKMK